jgi:hypothetical protein
MRQATFWVFAAVIGLAGIGRATTIARLDLPQMVRAADAIVVGRVVAADPHWMGGVLFTRYTLAVEETLLGEGRQAVHVLAPGGIDRGRRVPIGMAVAGAPTFVANERALLLLTAMPDSPGDFALVGFNQGRFTVADGQVQPPATTGAAGPRRDASSEPLATLKRRVRTLVQERGSQPAAQPAPRPRRIR